MEKAEALTVHWVHAATTGLLSLGMQLQSVQMLLLVEAM